MENNFQFDEICQPKRLVTFWSPERASRLLGEACYTYHALRAAELTKKNIASTTLLVDDQTVQSILQIFEQQTNEPLKHHDAVPTMLRLVTFRNADYETFEKAKRDGAVYDTGVTLSLGAKDLNGALMQTALSSMQATSKMINDGQSMASLAIIDEQGSDDVAQWKEVAVNAELLTHFFSTPFIHKVLIGYDDDIPR